MEGWGAGGREGVRESQNVDHHEKIKKTTLAKTP